MLKRESAATDLISTVRTVRQVIERRRHLRRQPDDVLRHRAAGLDAPTELARERPRDLVDFRSELDAQQRAAARVDVNAAHRAADSPFAHQTMHGKIDRGAAAERREITGREGPTRPLAFHSLNCFSFNALRHFLFRSL